MLRQSRRRCRLHSYEGRKQAVWQSDSDMTGCTTRTLTLPLRCPWDRPGGAWGGGGDLLTETNVSGTLDSFIHFLLACPPLLPLPLGNPCMARIGVFPAAEYHCKNFRSSPFFFQLQPTYVGRCPWNAGWVTQILSTCFASHKMMCQMLMTTPFLLLDHYQGPGWFQSWKIAAVQLFHSYLVGIVGIPESSALTLRLLDDDEDTAHDAVVGTREVVPAVTAREVAPLLEMTAESKSLTIFFLWAGVIFDQLLSEVARWLNSRTNLYWPLPDSERITSSRWATTNSHISLLNCSHSCCL